MLNMTNGEITPDDEVVFWDGFLYIISQEKECYEDKDGWHETEYSLTHICLCAEFDEPITLADIAKKYPCVTKVIFDDALRGSVYNHGNHVNPHDPDAEEWELVGETLGYA